MSEHQEKPLPPWVGDKGFITAAEWRSFDSAQQSEWTNFANHVGWLLDQPTFRAFVFTFLNDSRFCGTDASPLRSDVNETYRAIGIQDAGRMLRLVLQSVSPRRWMQVMHDAFNSRKSPEGGKE